VFRIDPIKEDGSFDTDFYGSYNYVMFRKALERYLKTEGFKEILEPMIFQFANRSWRISGKL
jgi:hypothetical protein